MIKHYLRRDELDAAKIANKFLTDIGLDVIEKTGKTPVVVKAYPSDNQTSFNILRDFHGKLIAQTTIIRDDLNWSECVCIDLRNTERNLEMIEERKTK